MSDSERNWEVERGIQCYPNTCNFRDSNYSIVFQFNPNFSPNKRPNHISTLELSLSLPVSYSEHFRLVSHQWWSWILILMNFNEPSTVSLWNSPLATPDYVG